MDDLGGECLQVKILRIEKWRYGFWVMKIVGDFFTLSNFDEDMNSEKWRYEFFLWRFGFFYILFKK